MLVRRTYNEIRNLVTLCAPFGTRSHYRLVRSNQQNHTGTTRLRSLKLSASETNDLFAHIRNALHSYQSPLGHPSEARRWCLTVVIDGVKLRTYWPDLEAAEAAYGALRGGFAGHLDEGRSGDIELAWGQSSQVRRHR